MECECRRNKLPLVCKSWNNMSQDFQVWQEASFYWTRFDDSLSRSDSKCLRRFFAIRGASLQKLKMTFPSHQSYAVSELIQGLGDSRKLTQLYLHCYTLGNVSGRFRDSRELHAHVEQASLLVMSAASRIASLQYLQLESMPVSFLASTCMSPDIQHLQDASHCVYVVLCVQRSISATPVWRYEFCRIRLAPLLLKALTLQLSTDAASVLLAW